MDITVRIYTDQRGCKRSRAISLNEGEIDGMIGSYLCEEEYIDKDECIEAISYETVNL